MKLDLQAVKHRIPHREPILLVDAVTSFTPFEQITTTRHLPAGDPLFEGHFPAQPIFPGALSVEALAQTSALLINLSVDKTADETIFLFMGIENAKFRQMITPGADLDMVVTMVQRRGHVFKFKGEVKINGKVATQANFTAKLVVKNEQ